MYRKLLLGVVAFSAFVFMPLFGVAVFAQEEDGATETTDLLDRGAAGFRISPAREQLELAPGQSETRTITIRNVTNNVQTARAVVDDFAAADDESGSPRLLIDSDAVENYEYSIKPFVRQLETLTLEPGQERELDITYTIPDSTAPGSYFGVVRFVTESEEEEIEGEAGVTLDASVGLVVLIDVPGDTVDLLNLVDANIAKDGEFGSLFSSAPDSYVVRIRNDGNTFQAPFGSVKVTDWSGNIIHEYEINGTDPRGNVLPNSIRRFEDPLLNIGSFGRYTVEANISYGDGGNIISVSNTFWVIPWTQILIGTVVLAVVVFGATKGLKAYNKNVVDNSKGSRVKKK